VNTGSQNAARDDREGLDAHGARDGQAAPPILFELTVDDAGQFLVACGTEFVLGHIHGGRADLPFLADVGAEHARLECFQSLRSGPGWRIVPLAGERVTRGGEPVPPEGVVLRDGDRLALGRNLGFRFRAPDPASATVLLELVRGAECLGSTRVVLFAEGPGGRLRVGAGGQRHVRVPRLEAELTLTRTGDRLAVASHGGLGRGLVPNGAEVHADELALPPTERRDWSVGKASAAGPPVGLSVAPAPGLEDQPRA